MRAQSHVKGQLRAQSEVGGRLLHALVVTGVSGIRQGPSLVRDILVLGLSIRVRLSRGSHISAGDHMHDRHIHFYVHLHVHVHLDLHLCLLRMRICLKLTFSTAYMLMAYIHVSIYT